MFKAFLDINPLAEDALAVFQDIVILCQLFPFLREQPQGFYDLLKKGGAGSQLPLENTMQCGPVNTRLLCKAIDRISIFSDQLLQKNTEIRHKALLSLVCIPLRRGNPKYNRGSTKFYFTTVHTTGCNFFFNRL